MATARKRLKFSYNPLVPGVRRFFHNQSGWDGDKKSTYPYFTVKESVSGTCYNPFSGVHTAYDAGNSPGNFAIPGHKRQSAYNSAYGVFMYRAKGAAAEWAALLGEYRQTSSMIRNRAQGILNFTKALLKKFKGWKRKAKNRLRTFADMWLEYSFGWAPAFGDIWNGYKVMCGDVGGIRTYGGGRCYHEGTTPGTNPKHSFWYQYTVLIFGLLKVTNPNTYMLNSLGLLNPLYTAWELVPWSFVFDWMFDIGSHLRAWSDTFGCELLNSGVSFRQIGSTTQTWTVLLGKSKSDSLVAQRVNSVPLPLPNLDVPKNIGENLKRAANAIALVIQLVVSGKPLPGPIRPRGRR